MLKLQDWSAKRSVQRSGPFLPAVVLSCFVPYSDPRLCPKDRKAPAGQTRGKSSSCTYSLSAEMRGTKFWSSSSVEKLAGLAVLLYFLQTSTLLGFWPLSWASTEGAELVKKLLLEAQPHFELSHLLSCAWQSVAGVEWAGVCLHPRADELASSQGATSISTSRTVCRSCWHAGGDGKAGTCPVT